MFSLQSAEFNLNLLVLHFDLWWWIIDGQADADARMKVHNSISRKPLENLKFLPRKESNLNFPRVVLKERSGKFIMAILQIFRLEM